MSAEGEISAGAPGLIETLRVDAQGVPLRLDRHLRRLAHCAAALGIPCAITEVRRQVRAVAEKVARENESRQGCRLRVLLRADGGLEVTGQPLPDGWPPTLPVPVILSSVQVNSTDPLLRCKTTRREHFDRAWAEASRKGAAEALLRNERGELTEGTRTNIFLRRNGRWLTPPAAAGLLPGILRAELLERGEAEERTLRPEDLADGELHIGNALRGLLPARLVWRP